MIRTARSLPLEAAASRRPSERVETPAGLLSRREATLRSAATTCLAGIALIQAIELPSLFQQGGQFAVLAMAIMAACVGLGLALAAAPDDAGVPLWRAVAIAAVAVLAGWAAPHLVTIPGLTHARGHWDSMPGAAAAGMAAVCLGVTVVAARPGLKALRGVAIALVVAIALAPPAGAFLFSVGPGLTGGQAVLASGGHIHAVGSGENAIVFQPGPNGGRYVYKAKAPAHETALGIALIVAAAAVFTYGAVGYLRGRTAPRESAVAGDIERGLA